MTEPLDTFLARMEKLCSSETQRLLSIIRDLAAKLERAEEQRDTAWIDADVEVTRILEAFREACEHVHATANGDTYGLTVDEQLQALRSAAKLCSAALALGREIGKE